MTDLFETTSLQQHFLDANNNVPVIGGAYARTVGPIAYAAQKTVGIAGNIIKGASEVTGSIVVDTMIRIPVNGVRWLFGKQHIARQFKFKEAAKELFDTFLFTLAFPGLVIVHVVTPSFFKSKDSSKDPAEENVKNQDSKTPANKNQQKSKPAIRVAPLSKDHAEENVNDQDSKTLADQPVASRPFNASDLQTQFKQLKKHKKVSQTSSETDLDPNKRAQDKSDASSSEDNIDIESMFSENRPASKNSKPEEDGSSSSDDIIDSDELTENANSKHDNAEENKTVFKKNNTEIDKGSRSENSEESTSTEELEKSTSTEESEEYEDYTSTEESEESETNQDKDGLAGGNTNEKPEHKSFNSSDFDEKKKKGEADSDDFNHDKNNENKDASQPPSDRGAEVGNKDSSNRQPSLLDLINGKKNLLKKVEVVKEVKEVKENSLKAAIQTLRKAFDGKKHTAVNTYNIVNTQNVSTQPAESKNEPEEKSIPTLESKTPQVIPPPPETNNSQVRPLLINLATELQLKKNELNKVLPEDINKPRPSDDPYVKMADTDLANRVIQLSKDEEIWRSLDDNQLNDLYETHYDALGVLETFKNAQFGTGQVTKSDVDENIETSDLFSQTVLVDALNGVEDSANVTNRTWEAIKILDAKCQEICKEIEFRKKVNNNGKREFTTFEVSNTNDDEIGYGESNYGAVYYCYSTLASSNNDSNKSKNGLDEDLVESLVSSVLNNK